MPKATKLGPGRLKFGAVGSEQEFASQVTKVELEPDYDSDDAIPTLDGGELPGDETMTYTLSGEFLQEYTMESLIVWCKANEGDVLPFEFVPTTTAGLKVTGEVVIRAVTIGGDVKKTNTTEFEFPGVGDYDIAAVNAA